MPMPLVEEGEEGFEDGVGDVDLLVLALDAVHRKHPAVQVGDASVFAEEVVGAGGDRLVEPIAEKLLEEAAVEGFVEPVLPPSGLDLGEPVAKVVLVEVEEALLLDEVAEHQAVEHHGGVPLAILRSGDVPDALHEGVVLLAEGLVELLRDFLGIGEERLLHGLDDFDRAGNAADREGEATELFEEEGALGFGFARDDDELAAFDGTNGDCPELA